MGFSDLEFLSGLEVDLQVDGAEKEADADKYQDGGALSREFDVCHMRSLLEKSAIARNKNKPV